MDLAGRLTLDAVEAVKPDALTVLVAQRLVVQGDVDAAEEGRVEAAHAVRGKEEGAAVVLECTEEDGHDTVAPNVGAAAALEVDIGLVKEDNGAVALAQLEEVVEVVLDVVVVGAQVAAGQGEQGPAGELGNALGGARLAYTGRSVEEEDAALALVLTKSVPQGDTRPSEAVAYFPIRALTVVLISSSTTRYLRASVSA
jgi:hypothetical protein